jgi:hypothetical protein
MGNDVQRQGLDIRAMRDREFANARRAIAVAQRRPEAMQASEQEGRGIDRSETLRRTEQMVQNPLFRQKLDGMINERNSSVTVARNRDAKNNEVGPYIATIVEPGTKKGRAITLSDADYLQLAHAHVLAAEGDTEGAAKLMKSVNADLAAALEAGNKQQMEVGKFNETGRKHAADEKHNADTLAQSAQQHRERMRQQAAQNPTLSDASRKRLLDLMQRHAAAKTPAERALVEREYQMAVSAAATSDLGRPMALPNARANKPDITFADFVGMVDPKQPTSVRNPRNGQPMTFGELTLEQKMDEYNTLMGQGEGGGDGLPNYAPRSPTQADARRGEPAPAAPTGGLPTPQASPPMDMRAAGYNVRPQVVAPEPPRPTGPGTVPAALDGAYHRYLSAKIARGERLEPNEQIRAQRAGLIK